MKEQHMANRNPAEGAGWRRALAWARGADRLRRAWHWASLLLAALLVVWLFGWDVPAPGWFCRENLDGCNP